MRVARWLVLALIPAVIASVPLFGRGYLPTHDGEYHLIRFAEFDTMLEHGIFFPRWAPNLNSGYGVPLFNFQYPLPNYIGVLLHRLGISYPDGVKGTLAIGYLTAVVFVFLWLETLFGAPAAALAATVFAYVPYWFLDIYVRGSVGEVWAFTWFGVSLWAAARSKHVFLTAAVTGMILSHNIQAMIFLPILAGYLALFKRPLLPSLALGVSSACYFWLPALWEKQYVQGLVAVNFRDHFPQLFQLLIPSWGTGFSGGGDFGNAMSYQIGIVPLLAWVGVLMFMRKEKDRQARSLIGYFMAVNVLSFFLLGPWAAVIWDHSSVLPLLQYPWRLLSLYLFSSAFFAGVIAKRAPRIGGGIAILAVLVSFSYSRPVLYDARDDAYYLSRREFTDGTSSPGNAFSTIWTAWKPDRPEMPVSVLEGTGMVDVNRISPYEYRGSVSMAGDGGTIRVHTLYYPGWTAVVDGKDAAIGYRKEGLIDLEIMNGVHTFRVFFVETRVRKIADFISVLSLFAVIGSGILKMMYADSDRYHTADKQPWRQRDRNVHQGTPRSAKG